MPSHPMPFIARLLLVASACAAASFPALGSEPVRSEQELRAFYRHSCAICHGVDGSAVAHDGRRLKGRDFTSVEAMRGASDEALAKTIRQGLFFGLGMPAFKRDITNEEALILVRDILRKARKGEPILAQAPPAEPKRAQVGPTTGPR